MLFCECSMQQLRLFHVTPTHAQHMHLGWHRCPNAVCDLLLHLQENLACWLCMVQEASTAKQSELQPQSQLGHKHAAGSVTGPVDPNQQPCKQSSNVVSVYQYFLQLGSFRLLR